MGVRGKSPSGVRNLLRGQNGVQGKSLAGRQFAKGDKGSPSEVPNGVKNL